MVKSYPAIRWDLAGLPPLRLALVFCVAVTAVVGILSRPLFSLADQTVALFPP